MLSKTSIKKQNIDKPFVEEEEFELIVSKTVSEKVKIKATSRREAGRKALALAKMMNFTTEPNFTAEDQYRC